MKHDYQLINLFCYLDGYQTIKNTETLTNQPCRGYSGELIEKTKTTFGWILESF